MHEYNSTPEGLVEITQKEYMEMFFHYCLNPVESRQVCDGKHFDLRMFGITTFDESKIGLAIMRDWFDNDTQKTRKEVIYRYCRYGKDEDWKRFTGKFIAQFQGDNS